jgi:hypothetical protein
MAKYLLVYHGGGGMAEGEAAQAEVMAAWGTWFQNLGPALADGGNPVGQSKTIASDGAVSDGGGANAATGYSLITADSLDAAVALAKGCPVLGGGSSVEVAETFDVM